MTVTRTLVLGLAAAAATAVAIADAHAQARRGRAEPPPLTIQRRSFLDPGRVVPVDSMRNYVLIGTYLNQPVYDNQRGRFGLETLPRRFDPPGRPSPLFNF
ncbi:MAG TPA: hypothetical protein VIL72_02830 [Beijerinckiaceae bacterium]|jgi:hypothetical protein